LKLVSLPVSGMRRGNGPGNIGKPAEMIGGGLPVPHSNGWLECNLGDGKEGQESRVRRAGEEVGRSGLAGGEKGGKETGGDEAVDGGKGVKAQVSVVGGQGGAGGGGCGWGKDGWETILMG